MVATTNSNLTPAPTGSNPLSNGFTVGLATARYLDASLLVEASTPLETQPTASPTTASVAIPTNKPVVDKQDSDSSITDYMSQLMDRVNGGSNQPKTPDMTSAAAIANCAKSGAQLIALKPQDAVMEAPLTQEEFIPKKQAPEKFSDMNSLRKIANESTRDAMSSYAAKQKKSLKSASLVCVGVSLTASVALYFLSQKLGDVQSIVAFGGVAVALISIVKFALDSRTK
jgi:hypothetical protein